MAFSGYSINIMYNNFTLTNIDVTVIVFLELLNTAAEQHLLSHFMMLSTLSTTYDGGPCTTLRPGILGQEQWIRFCFSLWPWSEKWREWLSLCLTLEPWTGFQTSIMGLSSQEYWSEVAVPSANLIHTSLPHGSLAELRRVVFF